MNKRHFKKGVAFGSSEQGSTLVYVMILMSVAGIYFYYQMQKPDQYSVYTLREKQVAFTMETADMATTSLFCPGGSAKISAQSCSKSKSIKLSINQIRNMVYQAQAAYQLANGKLPPVAYSAPVLGIVLTRIECYRTQSDINPSTSKPYVTPSGVEICGKIKGIDPTILPFPMASLLKSGMGPQYDFNVGVLTTKVVPEINTQVSASIKSVKAATDEYKKAFDGLKVLQEFCKSAIPGQIDPNCTKLADLEKAKADAQAKLDQTKKMADLKDKLLQLKDFVENGILDQAPGMLSNIQLAAMQHKGGIWKRVMTEGAQGSYRYILANVPTLEQAKKIGVGDPPPLSESFNFQLLKFDPVCRDDASDPNSNKKQLVFSATIATDLVNKRFPDKADRASVMKGLERAIYEGKTILSGWVDLPVNIVPAKCTLIEEEDPVITN